ncbi:alpha/beta hydrolase [bacterium]|nr:MAG: alpha/beta hydrolase [bacterium]
MAVAIVDGLEVYYETRGSGAPLLMMAPGGFDATIDKWLTTNAWKGINALEKLSSQFQLIVYDRRESGSSGGRVEKLRWDIYARQAKGLLEHLKIDSAFIMGGCMGCSVALAFAVCFPRATRTLLLHWPVGGYRWKANSGKKFVRHAAFAQEKGLAGVVGRAREKKSFWQDAESGPWAPCIARDHKFAEAFLAQDQERYLGIVEASGRTLFDRDTAPGAEPEEILAIKVPALIVPGDDPSHATSAAHYLRECLPHAEFWNVMPPEQSTERVSDRILDFCRKKS